LPATIHTDMLRGMDGVHKKTLNLDEARLKRARRILEQPTDTATIHAALDWVIESQAMVNDLVAIAGKGRGLFRARQTRVRRQRG
jgi:hypothetical protein